MSVPSITQVSKFLPWPDEKELPQDELNPGKTAFSCFCQNRFTGKKGVVYHPIGDGIKHPVHAKCLMGWLNAIPKEQHRCPYCPNIRIDSSNLSGWRDRFSNKVNFLKENSAIFLKAALKSAAYWLVVFGVSYLTYGDLSSPIREMLFTPETLEVTKQVGEMFFDAITLTVSFIAPTQFFLSLYISDGVWDVRVSLLGEVAGSETALAIFKQKSLFHLYPTMLSSYTASKLTNEDHPIFSLLCSLGAAEAMKSFVGLDDIVSGQLCVLSVLAGMYFAKRLRRNR